MSGPTDASPAPTDVVTAMQVELNKFGELLYGTVGELQRDAQPSSIRGEDTIHKPDKPYDAAARGEGFGKEMVACITRLQGLAQQLAQPPDEQEQLDRIRALQQQSQQLSEQLQQEKAAAELKLRQAQDLFAVLASAALQHRTAQSSNKQPS